MTFPRNHAGLIHHKGEYYGGVERVKVRFSEPVFERKRKVDRNAFSVLALIRTNQNTEVSTSAKLEGQTFEKVN